MTTSPPALLALRQRLSLTCPWAVSFADAAAPDLELDQAFLRARAAATTARLAAGKAAWAVWASQMMRVMAEAQGTPLAALARSLAVADFSGARFDRADFATLQFPGEARFTDAVFADHAHFHGCLFAGEAHFRGAQFSPPGAWFDACRFVRPASFAHASWDGAAELRSAVFVAAADFSGTKFARDVWASDSRFEGPTCFDGAQITGEAGFMRCHFGPAASFSGTQFGASAVFVGAVFDGPASFKRASFQGKAWFRNARFATPARLDFASFQAGAEWPALQPDRPACATALKIHTSS